jgi:hypothetical protein
MIAQVGQAMARRFLAAALLGLLAAACIASMGVERDGKKYGVTRGVFRGRWWSCYERGCSYLSGEFYKEAEADFKQALVGRTRDTWQARTYGLHFVEFFPNRELGVTYYYLGRLDDAERFLKTSLDQIDTDRVHYYLDLVTKAKIARGELKDAAPPSVDPSIRDGAITASREVPLEIRASDDVAVARVSVNGKVLPQRGSAAQATFRDKLLLTEGSHEIRVEADDLADKATAKTVKVEVDLTGPTIGIFSPADGLVTEAASAHLEGATVDKNGVVSVALDDRVLAKSNGEKRLPFAADLPLSDGENIFVVIARDVAGNETRSAIKVFKGKPGSASAQLWRLKERAPERLEVASAAGTSAVLDLVAGAAAAGEDPVTIQLRSPDPDKPYRHNKTLCISGDALARTKIASLTINGQPFEELTGAPKESFSKRIPIDVKEGGNAETTVAVSVRAQDDQGHEAGKEFQVAVRPVHLDSAEAKMPVAVLAFAGAGIEPSLLETLRLTTESKLLEEGRFRVLDRTRLQDVLTEQQLAAALANPNDAISLGRLTNAHVFLVADVFAHDRNGVEVKARAVSPETSDLIATLDAYIEDKSDNGKMEAGCTALAAQLAKMFPRLSGELLAVKERPDGDEMLVNWTKEDGVRPGMYLLVVQEGEPWVDKATGAVIEKGEVLEIGRGRIESVLTSGAKAKAVKREPTNVKFEKGMAAVTM